MTGPTILRSPEADGESLPVLAEAVPVGVATGKAELHIEYAREWLCPAFARLLPRGWSLAVWHDEAAQIHAAGDAFAGGGR